MFKFFLQDLDSDSETELDYKVSILMVIALHGFNKWKLFYIQYSILIYKLYYFIDLYVY